MEENRELIPRTEEAEVQNSEVALLDETDVGFLIKHRGVFIVLLVALVGLVSIAMLLSDAANKSAMAANEAYNVAKEGVINDIKQKAYDKGYVAAEAEFHVSNQVAIVVDSLRKEAELEVLEVYDVEYVIMDESSDESGIVSWLMVPGKGVYTVDLTATEFIVDNERRYVLVRVPEPELKNCTIVYKDVEQLFFDNSGFNESISVGEDKARKQLQDGYLLIQKTLGSNSNFYQSAELSAERMIIGLVKSLNVKVTDLTVEVEFIN